MEFTGVKKAAAGVHGFSVINHKIRISLNLTMTEYAVALYLEDNLKNPKILDPDKVWRDLGLRNINKVIQLLINDKVLKSADPIVFSEIWTAQFNKTEQFDRLWEIFLRKGNKEKSKILFSKVIREVEVSELLKAATAYMKTKDPDPIYRKYIMGLEVWLNPKNKHWEDVHEQPGDTTIKYKRNG